MQAAWLRAPVALGPTVTRHLRSHRARIHHLPIGFSGVMTPCSCRTRCHTGIPRPKRVIRNETVGRCTRKGGDEI